jgi:hypothetical protein
MENKRDEIDIPLYEQILWLIVFMALISSL